MTGNRRRIGLRLAALAGAVGLAALGLVAAGVSMPNPLDPNGHFASDGVSFDYPRSWKVTGPGPILLTGGSDEVAVILIGEVDRGEPLSDKWWTPQLGQDSALVSVRLGHGMVATPACPSPQGQRTILSGKNAVSTARASMQPGSNVEVEWTVPAPGCGQESIWALAMIRGPHIDRLRAAIDAMVRTVRIDRA